MKRKRLSLVDTISSGDDDNNNNNNSDDDYDNSTTNLTEEWRVNLVSEDETRRIVMESVQPVQPTNEMINPVLNAAQLFKIETLADISTEAIIASKTTKTTPQYRIIASDYAVCCLIDKQVYLFNTDCTAHEAAIMLDCRAELATFSKSSRFLVVVDQWGSIHFVHRLSRNVIYSQSINSNTNTNNSSDDNPFITNMETTFSVVMFNQSKSDKMEANELESLFIVYNKTQLLMLRNMDLKRLDDAIQSKDSSTIQQIKDKMVTLHVDLSSYHHQVNDIIQHDSKLIIAGNGRATISVWNYIDADSDTTESNICIHDYVEHDNRVKETRQLLLHPQGQLLISLNEHGHIIVWHLPTLIQVGSSRKHTSLLFDTIQWTALYPSMNSITILALSKAMDAQRHACIIDMPNFTVKQQWHISLNASLASQAYTRKSDILWLEYNDAPLSRSLSIRSLSGMTPILRYQQLLRKHKYDKANQWAMQHQLDVKLITEYRLQHFVTVNEQCKRVHASAIINLDQIESVIADLNNLHQSNLGYGITFCIHARAETATITRQLLEWAESNVVRLDNNEETSDLIEELRSTVNRFGTWKYTLSLNTSSSSIDMDWRAFQHTDLLKLLQHYLMHDQLNSVAIIWRRHYHELKPNIDQIIQWFNEVSDSVLVSSQIWLQDQVIPWLKSTNINDLQTFYQWLQGRARRIEQHDERPHRAFELMKLTTNSKSWYLLNSVTPSCYIQHTLLSSTCNPLDNSIESTCLLYYKQLQDRCYLWDQLSIRISLQIYNQKSPSQIGLWILLRAQQVDTLIDTIEKQLMPYTKRHQLQLTDVLSSYIKLLLEKQSDDWLSLTIAVINYVSIPRLNEDTLLEWMRCLPVPWSSSVDDLLRQIVTHYMNETSIKEQYRLLLLRRRLLSYGLTELNMADLGFIRRVVLYIIRQVDRRDALDDALKMADIYYHLKPHQIYVERMQALVEANQVDEAVLVYQQLLKSYSNNSNQQSFRDRDIDPWQIGEEMIYWLIDLTEEWECIDSQQQYAILKMMQEIMSTVLTERPVTQMKALNSIIHTDYLTSVQQSLRLLEEFSISMLPSSSMTDESRLHLFEHHITQLSLAETERLGSILGINQWEIKIRWILNRVDSKEQDVDIHTILWIILQEMLATSCSISHNLWHLFSHLINRILLPTSNNQLIERHESTREKMIKYMLLIIQQQIRYCIPLSISEQLDQFIRYELLQHLFSHTVQGAYTRTMTTTMSYKEQQSMMTTYIMSQTLPLMNWLFEGQYQHFWENTLVMDTNIMLDKVASILQMTTNDTTFINKGKSLVNTHLLNSHDSKMLPDIIHYLQEHRSLSSAIRLILWDMTRQQRQQSNGTSMINHDTISVKSIYELIKPMAQKILNVKAVHPLWAITYLTALPQETAFDIYRASLASVGTQYDRLARLASIGMICASQWKQRTFMLDCRQLAVNAHWWQQFQCLGIEFSDNAFRASLSTGSDYQRMLLPTLLKKTEWDISTVFEFAQAYQLNEDETCFICIETILLHRQALDAVQLTVAVNQVENKHRLIERLETKCIPYISGTDYERLQLIYKQISQLESQHESAKAALMILTCLLDYERLCKHRIEKLPFNNDDDEEEQDAVLNHRISFHDLRSNAWSILSSMIDMHNVHILLPLHIPLQLSADQFYKQAIESALSTNDESNEEASSHKSTKHQIDFDRLSNLVKKIQDQSQAINMLKYIISAYNSDHIDVINNRIEALEMACSWCTSWSEHLSVEQKQETLNETLQQFQQQLNECRTHAILCTNGWLILKPYISDPLILIRELYSMNELWTPLIDQHQHQHRKSCTKESVNMLISMLCKHYKLQSDKVLSAILMEWLKEPISSSITSTTYLLSTWLQMTSHTDEQEEHRRVKLVRLMQTTLYEKRVSYLLKFAYQPSHKIPTVARIRALTVLFMVADAQAITRVHRYEDVREYLHLLLYMVDFEDLRISQSLKEFHACDKLALARSLWISHSHDVKVVKLIGNLCMDFKLYDLVLWEHLLTHLVQAREIDYMTRILEHIDTISELSRLTVIPTIKSRLVHTAIDELATSTLSNHYNELRIMALIHRQSGSLDEQEMIRIVNYAQRTLPIIVVLRLMTCLPNSEELAQQRKMLVNTLSANDIQALLVSIQMEGVQCESNENDDNDDTVLYSMMGHSYRVSIKALYEDIFDRIDTQGFYQTLMQMPRFATHWLHPLVDFLVQHDRLNQALTTAINMNMMGVARAAVKLYYTHHSIEKDQQAYLSSLTIDADNMTLDPLDPLEIYLYAKNITF